MRPELKELNEAMESLIAQHPERVSLVRMIELATELEAAGLPGDAKVALALADTVFESA